MTTIIENMKQSMQAYQDELKTLRCKKPATQEEFDDFYDGKVLLEECGNSGEDAEEFNSRFMTPPRTTYSCNRCYLPFEPESLIDGKLPRHARMLQNEDQVGVTYGLIRTLMGFDRYRNEDVLAGSSAVRDARRTQTQSGRLAAGLPHLTAALIKREASVGVSKVVSDLLGFSAGRKLHDDMEADFPFFSEGTLYELVGKDTARSILACTRDLAAVTGYTRDVG